ncbi:MAG: hypothetical protein WC536_01080 [Patescibacteria group bacterium]
MKNKKPSELTEGQKAERRDIVVQFLTEGVSSHNDSRQKEFFSLLEKPKRTSAEEKRMSDLGVQIIKLNGLQNGHWVGHIDFEEYDDSLKKMRNDLAKEFDCKTGIELMLVDRIVANYWQTMRCDMVYNRCLVKKDGSFTMDQLKINYMKELSKNKEKAERQLNASIILLKELKQPKLNVKISTKNAFLANNQQVINNYDGNDNQSENN